LNEWAGCLTHKGTLSVEFARSFDQLRAAAIKSVLSVGFDLELGEQGFDYLCFPDVVDVDSEVILDLFPKAIAFIEEGFKKGPVLVHCAAGRKAGDRFQRERERIIVIPPHPI